MRRQFDFRLFANISFLTVLVVSFSYFNVRLPSLRPFLSKYLVSDATSDQSRDSPRRSLLIVGKGRSGTSFVSKMFASADLVSKQHNKGIKGTSYSGNQNGGACCDFTAMDSPLRPCFGQYLDVPF